MNRATTLAAAFVNAAVAAGGIKSRSWVARNVADKAIHTAVGVVKEKDINVHCSARTRVHIKETKGVDVWA